VIELAPLEDLVGIDAMSARDHRDGGANRQRFFRDAPPFLLRTVLTLDDWLIGSGDVCDSGCWHR